jgi:DNA-binding transcriptional LysR family regulator
MDLRRFITLKTVVEEGSFLRASQKLCCTQSTVTFHIQQLEQEFSVQLFEKIGRRMCLTREGKKLLPHIYELTRVMDTLREAAKKESDPDGTGAWSGIFRSSRHCHSSVIIEYV